MFLCAPREASALQMSDIASGSAILNLDKTMANIELKAPSLEKSYKTAAVCFMGFGDCDNIADYDVNTINQCEQEGYKKNNCSPVQEPTGVCPYNPGYSSGCKCRSNLVTCPAGQVGVGAACGGKYASCQCSPSLVSCASNQTGTGATCGGKYQSCTCKPEYQYYSSNCASPRSLTGSSCGGKYTGCSCPTGVSTGSFGCKSYYASPCGSVCKEAYGDNCHRRTAVSTPYGCASYFADCSSKCEKAYTDNCRNRTAVTCQYGCASNFSDCQSKCQACKSDNCANRTAVDAPDGCQTYWADCPSKCQIPISVCPGYEKKAACPNKYYKKEICPQDGAYIKCTSTCGSRIVDDNPTYKIDEGNYNGVTVVTKDGVYVPSSQAVYSNINYPQYAECAVLPKPKFTMTTTNGFAAQVSVNRIENIDIVVNWKPWSKSQACIQADQFRYTGFCDTDCRQTDCDCSYGCMSNKSCRDYNYTCSTFYDIINSSSGDPCHYVQNYESNCTNTTTYSVGLELYPSNNIRTETYTACTRGSRSYYEGTLKNVDITITGDPQIGIRVGGGAHIDKTIKFEGTNSVKGGRNHSFWVRGHNTCAYGLVRGVLQVNSGGRLTVNKPVCAYTQWKGSVVTNGSLSGTIQTNCATYPLTW